MKDNNIEILEFDYEQNTGNKEEDSKVTSLEDKNAFLYGLIGFFVPIAGLVLYLAHKYDRPKCSAAAEIGMVISILAMFLISILCMIVFVAGLFFMI